MDLPDTILMDDLDILKREWLLSGGVLVETPIYIAFLFRGPDRLGCFDRIYEKCESTLERRRLPEKLGESFSCRECVIYDACMAVNAQFGYE